MSTGSSGFADYIMLNLRCAGLWAGLMANEIQTVSIALGAGLIDPDSALAHLHEAGVLPLIEASSS
jgi:hypothetical protein